MIFRNRQITPPSHIQICIRTNPEIGPMDVLMRSVRGDLISALVQITDVIAQALWIQLDDTGDCVCIPFGMLQMSIDPRQRNVRIGIGVGKPNALRVATLEVPQDPCHPETSRSARRTHVAFDHLAAALQAVSGQHCGTIRAPVRHDYDPRLGTPLTCRARLQDARNASIDKKGFVLSRNYDSDMPHARGVHNTNAS
jgi:hypothetical protein